MADINNRLKTSSLANLQVLHSFSNLNNHTSTFVACTPGSKLRHRWQCPVIHHEVDITHAKAGSIKLDENIFRARSWHGDILNLLKSNQSLGNTELSGISRGPSLQHESRGLRPQQLRLYIALGFGRTKACELLSRLLFETC